MKTLKRSIHICILTATSLLNIANQSFAETIDVTDKEGRAITARLVGYDGKNVEIFRISDSKTFTIPMDTLDDKTRTTIELWVKKGGNLVETYEVEVNSGKTSRRSGDFDPSYSSYSSRKWVNLEPDVSVKNTHTTMESRPLQITVLMIGRSLVDKSKIYVFRTQTIDIPKLAPLTSQKFKVDPVSQHYYDDGDYKWGSKYLGYVWIIHNKLKTEIVSSGSVPSSLTSDKPLQNYLEMKSERYYTDNLLPVKMDDDDL